MRGASILSQQNLELKKWTFKERSQKLKIKAMQMQSMMGSLALYSLPRTATMIILRILIKSPPAAVPIVYLDTTENPKKFIIPQKESCAMLPNNPTQNESSMQIQNPKSGLLFVRKLTKSMRAIEIFVPVIPTVTILLYVKFELSQWKVTPVRTQAMNTGIGKYKYTLQSSQTQWKQSIEVKITFHPNKEVMPLKKKRFSMRWGEYLPYQGLGSLSSICYQNRIKSSFILLQLIKFILEVRKRQEKANYNSFLICQKQYLRQVPSFAQKLTSNLVSQRISQNYFADDSKYRGYISLSALFCGEGIGELIERIHNMMQSFYILSSILMDQKQSKIGRWVFQINFSSDTKEGIVNLGAFANLERFTDFLYIKNKKKLRTQQKNINSAMGIHTDQAILKDNISGIAHPECRICLMHDEHQNLISPCNCSGSLQFVHSGCLESWINTFLFKSKDKVKGKKAHVYCQLCKGKISFTVAKRTECKSKQQACEKIHRKPKTFAALVALMLINFFIFLALLGYIISSQGFSKTRSQALLYPISIVGEVIFTIVVISSTIVLSKKFLLNKKIVVCQILSEQKKNEEVS